MTWQRRARLTVAAFLVVFGAALYFAIGRRPESTTGPVVERTDPRAISETKPGTLTLANGETISFAHLLTYADGRSVMQDVAITMRDQKGRLVTVKGREAVQQASSSSPSRVGEVAVKGDVVITTSDGLRLTTAEVHYSDATGVLRAPGRVAFQRNRLSGSGLGATYDRAQDVLWLLDQAQVGLAPDARGQGGLAATAGTAGLARPDHYLRFERGVRIERADRTIDAAEATFHLTEDETRLTLAELRGGARVSGRESTPVEPGSPVSMQATDIDLQYGDDGATLRRATLTGDAGIDLAGDARAAGRTIRAARLATDLAPDGVTITTLAGRDAVQLDLPAAAERPAQTIRAQTLDAHGTEREGLRSARFTGAVEFREHGVATRTSAAVERVARSAALDVTLEPQAGGVASARFLGSVLFTDGTWRGEASEARYDPNRGVLALSVAQGPQGPPPRVADDRITVDAGTIELTLRSSQIVAEGRVQSMFRPPAKTLPAAKADATHLPSLLDETQPLYVTGAKLVYDGQHSVATFSGEARLRQGESLVRGDTVSLDARQGNLSAAGRVSSTLMIGEARAGVGATPSERTIGEGQEMQYDDSARKTVYRGAARVVGTYGDVTAGRIELILSEAAHELVRADAYDDVTARLEGGSTVTGKRLTYFVDAQRYLAQGQPARIVEEKPDGCRETVGAVLTYVRSTDTITVEGTAGNRSRTRPVPCAERRR